MADLPVESDKRLCCILNPYGTFRCVFCKVGSCYTHSHDTVFGFMGSAAHSRCYKAQPKVSSKEFLDANARPHVDASRVSAWDRS